MSLTVKQDYVAEGLDLLRQGYKDRPQLAALLTGLLVPVQSLEMALAGLADGFSIDTATGATLDGLGSLVGADRNGLDDATYRLFIYGQIASNTGNATTDAIVGLAKKLFQTNAVFAKTAQSLRRTGGPTGAFLQLGIGSPKLPARLWPLAERLLRQNVAGGIRLDPLVFFNATGSLACAGDAAGAQPWAGVGFGSINDSTAGAPAATLLEAAS